MRSFKSLNEQEILALAIALEEEDARIYGNFADGLAEHYPGTVKILIPRRVFCKSVFVPGAGWLGFKKLRSAWRSPILR